MIDPFSVLGVDASAGEEEIRRRYLLLVRENPPERNPERFAEIRAAYDQVRDPETVWERRLFALNDPEPPAAVFARHRSATSVTRYPTDLLLTLGEK